MRAARRALVLAALAACAACAVLGACAGGEGMKGEGGVPPAKAAPEAVRDVVAGDALEALRGQRVRVRGKVERAKLGDQLASAGFTVMLVGERLADAQVGTTVSVVGTLGVRVAEEPLVNAKGEIRQGEEPGTRTWLLADWHVDPANGTSRE